MARVRGEKLAGLLARGAPVGPAGPKCWAAGKERGEEVWAGLVSCWTGSRLSFLFSFSISFLFQTPHKLFEFK